MSPFFDIFHFTDKIMSKSFLTNFLNVNVLSISDGKAIFLSFSDSYVYYFKYKNNGDRHQKHVILVYVYSFEIFYGILLLLILGYGMCFHDFFYCEKK